ncbi:MAG: TatD family hydrolase [Bacteroidales bacterium]|nr:TatD family hydrolase [Bacteroidales bacterium]
MIDTHVHLYDQAYDKDRDRVVARAKEAGVTRCILPAIERSTYKAMEACLKSYPNWTFKAMGVHPGSIGSNYKEELDFARTHVNKAVAIGEVGLDFYRSREFQKEQIVALEEQIQWAKELDLPLIIHSRSAFPELLQTFKKCSHPNMRGILHAWSGGVEVFREANRYGHFYMGIGGVLTFRNARLAEVVKETQLNQIVLETDAPWLSPEPFRGKRNESAYLVYIADRLAQVKGTNKEYVVAVTTQNALSLFFTKAYE